LYAATLNGLSHEMNLALMTCMISSRPEFLGALVIL
jgi:hypothetical protein